MNAYDRLMLPENLNFAWNKVKRMIGFSDGYYNLNELAAFEINLEVELKSIRRSFESGSYQLDKLKPIPRPKKRDKKNKCVDRQYYHISVRDQVAWIALVNALGPELDSLMPAWSYGNRLYRPAWYQEKNGPNSKLEVGPYRHSSGYIYKKFQHSWPLFRRHVALTAKSMAKNKVPIADELEAAEVRALIAAEKERLPYLQKEFWRQPKAKSQNRTLYCASIDLKKFYPNISTKSIKEGLLRLIDLEDKASQNLLSIIDDLLDFRFDPSGFSAKALKMTEPSYLMRKPVVGLPTGLFAAGFLANAAMLFVDEKVQEKIEKKRNIAHFRFVDDHTIISYSFEGLCDWVVWYKDLLRKSSIGAIVNDKKYDPPSLGAWINTLEKGAVNNDSLNASQSRKRDAAIQDTRFDGANPTKLLTKTLAQVSTIAMTDVETLEDHDLRERLKQLEWLLLADIPDREIRPDTRAAFAAGQIARIAPLLAMEGDLTVVPSREYALSLSEYQARKKLLNKTKQAEFKERLNIQKLRLSEALEEQLAEEYRQYKICFNLLMQAFAEFPTKARLFLRLFQFCRVTGYNGIPAIGKWILRSRKAGDTRWADYYAGLALQTLSSAVLKSTKTLLDHNSLRSDIKASKAFLLGVAKIKIRDFGCSSDNVTWYYSSAFEAFTASLIASATNLEEVDGNCSNALKSVLDTFSGVDLNAKKKSDRRQVFKEPVAAWAHHLENQLAIDDKPSKSWFYFERLLNYNKRLDVLVSRRYPDHISKRAFKRLASEPKQLKNFDAGWLLEAIQSETTRLKIAKSSTRLVAKKAVKSLEFSSETYLNLGDWVEFLNVGASPFDPRKAEWTALEIIRQILEPIESEIGEYGETLDRLHPQNILLPDSWRTIVPTNLISDELSWEQWRKFVQNEKLKVKVLPTKSCLIDYRYWSGTHNGWPIGNDERRLVGIGRILLGVLSLKFKAPSLWNLRGNEQIIPFPNASNIEALAVSSQTTSILDLCLSKRSAESRTILKSPSLFAWTKGLEINDIEFDPAPILNPVDLLTLIRSAQDELENNQIAISQNRPRQLIPFDLTDFSKMDDIVGEEVEAADE